MVALGKGTLMDDQGHAVEFTVQCEDDADRYGALVNQVAQEIYDTNQDDDHAFVMVTTEMRGGSIVKRAVFERPDAARRFRMLLEGRA